MTIYRTCHIIDWDSCHRDWKVIGKSIWRFIIGYLTPKLDQISNIILEYVCYLIIIILHYY